MPHLDRAILASSARDQDTKTSSPGKMSSGDWILSAYIDKPGTDGGRPTRTDGDSDHPVAAHWHAAAGWRTRNKLHGNTQGELERVHWVGRVLRQIGGGGGGRGSGTEQKKL
jgi:hypothetical protein